MVRYPTVLVLILALLTWIASSCSAQDRLITPEQVLQIANEALRRDGLDTMPPSATVRAYDVPDNECLAHFMDNAFREKVIRTLEGRRYFIVLYVPPPPSEGGPLFGSPVCVMADRDTGKVIHVEPD